MIYFKYLRTHIPSGRQEVLEFNITKHSLFRNDHEQSLQTIIAKVDSLINTWNSRKPDEWKYELV